MDTREEINRNVYDKQKEGIKLNYKGGVSVFFLVARQMFSQLNSLKKQEFSITWVKGM